MTVAQDPSRMANIVNLIAEASSQGPLRNEGSEQLSGYSGGKLVGLLQRLPRLFQDESACYVEVGVFQGLTLLSVAGANRMTSCYGIDNFAYFDKDGMNHGIVQKRTRALNIDNAHVIDSDYEDALEQFPTLVRDDPIGVYFVDGPHDYRSQLICLLLAVPHLHRQAVIVVDDSNYAHVRQANRDFLRTHPEFRLLFQAYTASHPDTLPEKEKGHVRAGWWNGVNVIVRDPEGTLEYCEPPTERDRTRYENDHLVHSARLAELAPGAVRLTDALFGGRFPEALWLWQKLRHARKARAGEFRGRHKSRNTYSAHIAGEHWNISVDAAKRNHEERGQPRPSR